MKHLDSLEKDCHWGGTLTWTLQHTPSSVVTCVCVCYLYNYKEGLGYPKNILYIIYINLGNMKLQLKLHHRRPPRFNFMFQAMIPNILLLNVFDGSRRG